MLQNGAAPPRGTYTELLRCRVKVRRLIMPDTMLILFEQEACMRMKLACACTLHAFAQRLGSCVCLSPTGQHCTGGGQAAHLLFKQLPRVRKEPLALLRRVAQFQPPYHLLAQRGHKSQQLQRRRRACTFAAPAHARRRTVVSAGAACSPERGMQTGGGVAGAPPAAGGEATGCTVARATAGWSGAARGVAPRPAPPVPESGVAARRAACSRNVRM